MLVSRFSNEEDKFYFLFFVALSFFFAMLMPFSYGDLAIWIAEGQQVLQQQTIYIKDIFSYNPTTPEPYPWLSCLVYYFVDQTFGINFIFFFHRLIPAAAVTFWLINYPQLLQKKWWIVLAVSICGLSMLMVDRPALLILPLIFYFYRLIETGEIFTQKKRTWLLLLLWTNLHGSFVLFLILLGYSVFIHKKHLLFWLSCFAVTLLNPWGFKIYSYVYKTAALSKVRMTEWQSINFAPENQFETIFFLTTLLGLVIWAIVRKKTLTVLRSPISFIALSAANAVRNLPLFFLMLPIFVGQHLADEKSESLPRTTSTFKVYFHRFSVLLIVLASCFMFSASSLEIRKNLPARYAKRYDYTSCIRISEYLNTVSDPQKIFNSWVLGSFLAYSQKHQIFIDTRNIIYADKLFTDYLTIELNPFGNAEALLEQYNATYVVVDKVKPLAAVLETSQIWTFIMDDGDYKLFKKK